MTPEEVFDLVDADGRVVGQAPRSRCHADPSLMHQAVHVLVFARDGRLFLQKRSSRKDVQPGKWDTSVGGHLQPGETPEAAARREMLEELGKAPAELAFAYQYVWRASNETELIRAYATIDEGPFVLDPQELDDGRFWSFAEIEGLLGEKDRGIKPLLQDILTPCRSGFIPRHICSSADFTLQFLFEFSRIKEWWDRHHAQT